LAPAISTGPSGTTVRGYGSPAKTRRGLLEEEIIVRSRGAISQCADPRGAGIGRKVARKVRMHILRDRVAPAVRHIPHGVTRVFAPPTLDSHRRGQAVVEMAIILPLLVLLLVMALDAGRLFFGWVALENASRIGADYAASHSDAWDGKVDSQDQDWLARYELLITEDLRSLGCERDPRVPEPNFDPDGDRIEGFDDGDLVRVELACSFDLLTPLAESFLGAPVRLHGRSDFAINHTLVNGLPVPINPPPPVTCPDGEARVPDLVGMPNQLAYNTWVGAGFNGANYSPRVTNGNENRTVTTQSPAAGECQPLTAAMKVTL
jgi:hypothetical protein